MSAAGFVHIDHYVSTKHNIVNCVQVSHWLKQLCDELSERLLADLDQNKRIAHTLTLHVRAYKVEAQFRL